MRIWRTKDSQVGKYIACYVLRAGGIRPADPSQFEFEGGGLPMSPNRGCASIGAT
jgi:hypothetical protein